MTRFGRRVTCTGRTGCFPCTVHPSDREPCKAIDVTNRPWMPLYVADYLADTAHLNAAQSGAYLHLIMHYWTIGHLPTDDPSLSRIARMTLPEWRRNRPVVESFFMSGWRHKRVDEELSKAARLAATASSRARVASRSRWNGHAKPMLGASSEDA